jgi:hypothetical protein
MKKLLIALLALSVAGATVSAADAPALKLSGYFNTGFEYSGGDAFDDPTLSMFARDADSSPKGYRFQLDGAYDAGLYGTNFRMRAQGTANDPTFYMAYGYGWVKLFEIAKIKAGYVDDGTFNSMGDIDGDAGEGLGALLTVAPIDGLTVGLGIYPKDATRIETNSKDLATASGDSSYSNPAYALEYTKFTYSAAYEMKDLVKAALSIQAQKADDTATIDYKGSIAQLRAGVSVLAVPNLTAVFEYELARGNVNEGTEVADSKLTTLAGTFSYAVDDAITAGVVVYSWNSDFKGADAGFKVNPWATYAMGSLTPKLSVAYIVNDGAEGTEDDTEFQINPSCKYTLDKNASIDMGLKYVTFGSDSANADADIESGYTLYADFLWKF